MNVIVDDMARECLDDIYYYNIQFSYENAIEIESNILDHISYLEYSSYIGQYVPEIEDKHFRELLYKKNKHTAYRIIYYISERTNNIHIVYIYNCKQDFNRILTIHNYFSNYFKF